MKQRVLLRIKAPASGSRVEFGLEQNQFACRTWLQCTCPTGATQETNARHFERVVE